MIELYHSEEQARFPGLFRQLFELRHRVFVDRLGWVPPSPDGMERDRFDDLPGYHMAAYDESGALAGAWRFLPTTSPNMLRDVFPEVLEGRPAPCRADVWEASRFSVDADPTSGPGVGAGMASSRKVTFELIAGMYEMSLHLGITEIVTVYDIRIARLLPRLGTPPSWTGSTVRVGSTRALLGGLRMTHERLQRVYEAGQITGPVLCRLPWAEQLRAA